MNEGRKLKQHGSTVLLHLSKKTSLRKSPENRGITLEPRRIRANQETIALTGWNFRASREGIIRHGNVTQLHNVADVFGAAINWEFWSEVRRIKDAFDKEVD